MAVSAHGAASRAPFRRLLPVVLLPLVVACSTGPSGSPGAPSGSPTASPGASAGSSPTPVARLILRVTSEGGFIGPAANLNAVPEVSVYADGRILTPGAVDSIYPAPLLPSVAVRDVGPAGAAAITAAIRTAGLDGSGSFGPGVPGDTGTTIFAVNVDGAVVTTRIALGGGGPGRPGGGNPDPAAAAASDFLARLNDPDETWGAGHVATGTLSPVAYRLYVAPGAPASDGQTSAEPAVTWPLTPDLDAFGVPANPDRGIPGLRQGAVFGPDALTLRPVLAAANSQTAFISGGMLYTIYPRPLLPDEVPTQG